PDVTKEYLRQEIYNLLAEGYQIEVGLSIMPIPVLFALEYCGVADQPKPGLRTDAVQAFFPMPNVAEIEDSFVDGTYKRRNASNFINHEYQLFYSRFWFKYKQYLAEINKAINWQAAMGNPALSVFDEFRSRPQVNDLFQSRPLPDRVANAPASSR